MVFRQFGLPARAPRGAASLTRAAFGFLIVLLLAPLFAAAPAAAAQRYRSDDWITECERDRPTGGPTCTITVPFSGIVDGEKGSFALLVSLQSGEIGVVGQPFPLKARLQVDGNLPIECRGPRYCLFPREDSRAAIAELKAGSLVLIEVVTAKRQFWFSLTPKGFQAGINQIEAWGYDVSIE
jgi:hypothetical protein